MKSEHYYTKKPTSVFKQNHITAILRKKEFSFYTGSGVFSIKKVDNGTRLLIDKSIVHDNSRILDLGCGYGPVGIVMTRLFPGSKIVMTDINQRAVSLARKNLRLNGVEAEVVQGSLFENVKGKFNTIILNPPQNAGKQVCFDMIEQSKDFLKKDGLLQLVARHQKGGRSLSKKMREVFGNVKDIAKQGGFRVYLSVNAY